MAERFNPVTELFPGLTKEKAQIVARGLSFIETTHGCSCACRMCFLKAPVGVRAFMASSTISAIHDFIGVHDPVVTTGFSHHDAGQLSDYFDPETGWDMSHVINDCLRKTNREVALFLHGIDGGDDRALKAANSLLNLPEGMKRRVEVILSTDPFGPVHVPKDEAEKIGRDRALNALQIFHNWPKLTLRVFMADLQHDIPREMEKARSAFGIYMPATVEHHVILKPTRELLPGVNREAIFDFCNGYGILHDGAVIFKQFPGRASKDAWVKIGSLASLDPEKVREVSGAFI